jgi:hypothetical protein
VNSESGKGGGEVQKALEAKGRSVNHGYRIDRLMVSQKGYDKDAE